MTVDPSHLRFVETTQLSAEDITGRCRAMHASLLAESPYLDDANFTQIHPKDLRWLLDEYDRRFLEGRCRKLLGGSDLRFRISSRMTKAGGKTSRFVRQDNPGERSYEITVSSTLLYETFQQDHRPIKVTGIVCGDRLEALQRIMEHELVHLVEMLLWERSKCSEERFRSIARRFFGHTEHHHELITPREAAATRFGIRPGSRVRFEFEGTEYIGVVNRITRRATVLVEDPSGVRYTDGKHYAKFYVPLEMLRAVEQ